VKILKFIERFFPKLFIGIWLNNGRYYLTSKKTLPSGKISIKNISFDKDAELEKMFDFLAKAQIENVVTYIGLIDNSKFQGAIPVVETKAYLWFSEINDYQDFDDILFKREREGWTLFSLKTEILQSQNIFKKAGLDFIFSPFLIPIAIQKRFQLPKNTSIFILAEKDLTIFSIFKGDKLLFGRYIDDVDLNEVFIEESKDEIEDNQLFQFDELDKNIDSSAKFKNQSDSTFFNEDEIELDDLEIDQFDNLDKRDKNLLDLDDLILKVEDDNRVRSEAKGIEELQNFLDNDMKEENDFEETQQILGDMDLNYELIYQAIKTGVKTFYGNDIFESDFIENCYILTGLKISNSFIQQIEDEFSFETEKIRIELSELVVDLIGEELG